jgi:hypothetical protein
MAKGETVSGRVDARQPWEPFRCGVGGCEVAAVVVCDHATLARELRKLGELTQGARLGLCGRHWSRFRPGVALPSLGWGERVAAVAVEVAGKAARDGGARGAAGASDGPGRSRSRAVGPGRAAGAAPGVKPERLGFLAERSGLLHGSDPGRCTRAAAVRAELKPRRLTLAEWRAVEPRCACAGWMGAEGEAVPVEVEGSGRKGKRKA